MALCRREKESRALQPNIFLLGSILQSGALYQWPTAAGSLDTKASQSLRGRLQFADGQIFGRSSRLCLKALDSHIASRSGDLSSDTCNALKTYRQILNHGRCSGARRVNHCTCSQTQHTTKVDAASAAVWQQQRTNRFLFLHAQ